MKIDPTHTLVRRVIPIVLGLLVAIGMGTVAIPKAGAAPVAHAATANPTCGSTVGFNNDNLSVCIQASQTGLTFSMSGYTDYSGGAVGISFNGDPLCPNTVCNVSWRGHSYSLFIPLASGEYVGYVLISAGNGA